MQTIGSAIDERSLIGSRFTRPHPGAQASPAAIIAWADAETDAFFARLGKERPVPANQCPACRGRGYIGEGDSSEWCPSPGCTFGHSSRTCPTCGNIAVNPREFEKPCVCGDDAKLAAIRQERSGMPAKYRGWSFLSWWASVKEFQPAVIHDAYKEVGATARRIADGQAPKDGRPGLLLIGPTGRQKSGLAAAIAQGWNARAAGGSIWLAWAGWCDYLNGLRNAGGDDVAERRRAALAPLLIIDDLGADDLSTSYRRRVLLELLELRSPAAPVVVTSMYDLTELSDRFDEAAVGRLIELAVPVTLGGVDVRRAMRATTEGIHE